MLDISLRLKCTRKAGTLSRVVRDINLIGLQYKSHKIESDGDHSYISIMANGDLNCDLASLQEMLTQFPEVLVLEQLDVTRDGKAVTEIRTKRPETRISAQEPITPAVVLAAEKRLSQILGPASAFIVEMASDECANAGELFERLAQELNDEQDRTDFQAIIEK